MAQFLLLGSLLGFVLGSAHAVYLYREITARRLTTGGNASNARAACYGVWTLALWTLFGAYVLTLWLVGVVLSTLVRLLRRHGGA